MKTILRWALLTISTTALLGMAGSPALAQTNCACDNGQSVETTSNAPDACSSECQLVGADSGVPAPANYDDGDYDDDDADVVVPRGAAEARRPHRRR